MNCLLLVETSPRARLAQWPIKEKDALRIYPDSFAFTLLLGLMACLPMFGIDAPVPSLSATGDDLATTSAELGLASLMSLGAPPVFRPKAEPKSMEGKPSPGGK